MGKLTYLAKSYVDMINKTGKKYKKNKIAVAFDIVRSAVLYKASPANYYYFGFPERSDKERRTYVTHDMSERLQAKYNNAKYLGIFQNKYLFYQVFKSYMGDRDILSSKCMTQEEFSAFVAKNPKFVQKPIDGGQGKGIVVYNNLSPTEAVQLYKSLKKKNEVVILEGWIVQNDEMNRLYPKSVNPIRIQSVFDGSKTNILCATITIGHGAEYANASSHAIFALIDIETGVVKTDGCDYDGNKYLHHPDTGIVIKGFKVPYWNEVCKLIEKSAKQVPQIGYVGWDVAITKNQPIIIEGNNDPGYVAYQLADFGITQGMRAVYGKYLYR